MPRAKHLVTPTFGWEYPELSAEADISTDLHELLLQIENIVKALEPKFLKTAGAGDAGKLLVVGATGAPAFSAMSGDATIGNTGILAIGAEKVLTAMVANLAITAAKLGAESVEEAKIKALAVSAAKLAAEAVESAKIKNLAVTEAKLAELAVSTIKIAAGAVTRAKLSAGLIQTTSVEVKEVAASGEKAVTITWPQEFPDANYRVSITPIHEASAVTPPSLHGYLKAKNGVSCFVKNNYTGGVQTFTLDCIAIHD